MKRFFAVILSLVLLCLAVCAAEETGLADKLTGCWNVDKINAEGVMMSPATYGLKITLTLKEDGSAEFDYAGEIEGGMKWYVQDEKVYLKGYNQDGDVEIICGENSLQITDSIGDMYLSRMP